MHLAWYAFAYGEDKCRPKHHYSTHLPTMLGLHGMLIACFVHERHHKYIKRHARVRHNTKSYEVGIIEEVTIDKLWALQNMKPARGLQGSVEPSRTISAALAEITAGDAYRVARVIKTAEGPAEVGDVCFFTKDGDTHVGEIFLLFEERDKPPQAVVSRWPRVGRECDARVSTWRVRVEHRLEIIDATLLGMTAIYSKPCATSHSVILVPPKYR